MQRSLKYREAIQDAIAKGYSCSAIYDRTVPVHEQLQGKTIWKGEVEIFNLSGHPKAQRCYGWGFEDRPGHTEFVTVLEVPPVISPETAVRTYLVSQFKDK